MLFDPLSCRAALEREFEKLDWSSSAEDKIEAPPPAKAAISEIAIPNKVLLAEIQLLRKEMRIMQQAHTQEIAALRSLVEQLLANRK